MKAIYWDTSTEWIVIEIFEIPDIDSLNEIHKDTEITGNRDTKKTHSPEIIYSFKEYLPRVASTGLVSLIKNALGSAQLSKPDWIFVANGPGSFTGIRIAVATARNLSQLWKIPCLGLDTMEIYAYYYSNQYPDTDLAVIMDGKMNKFFFHHIPASRKTFQFYSSEPNVHTMDLTWEEIQPIIGNNTKLFSHTDIPMQHTLFSTDYPGLTGVPIESYWNPEFIDIDKDLSRFHYETLLPKYMRETYATKPIPTS